MLADLGGDWVDGELVSGSAVGGWFAELPLDWEAESVIKELLLIFPRLPIELNHAQAFTDNSLEIALQLIHD